MTNIEINSKHMKSLTVNTRRGPLYFQTNLSWEDAATTLINICERNEFVNSLVDKINSNKYMSDAQVSWVYYLAEKASAPKRESKPENKSVKADEILAALAQAYANKLKKPTIRLNNGIKVKFMARGNNAGGAWVTQHDDLVGKIDCNGDFFAYNNDDDLVQTIVGFNNNFEDKIRDAGITSGQCMCCGLPLTNQLSMRLGIGPICREKYFG